MKPLTLLDLVVGVEVDGRHYDLMGKSFSAQDVLIVYFTENPEKTKVLQENQAHANAADWMAYVAVSCMLEQKEVPK
jgi:hypothetical protein